MKRKVFLLAVVAICIAIAASGTLAYFTFEDTAHNIITSGGVAIKIVEKTKGENGALVDFPEEGIGGIMPASSVSKIVRVQNTGDSEAWIRIKMESEIRNANGDSLPTQIGEEHQPVISCMVLDGWLNGEDGYWYCKKPVAPDALTDILFEEIHFAPAMGNEYQNCTANIMISAQAVQAENNGSSITEAKGWPTESSKQGG